MAVFKKSDFIKHKLKELVDDSGAKIDGDERVSVDSEINSSPQETSDDFEQTATQPNRFYYTYAGSPYSRGIRVHESDMIRDVIESMLKSKDNKDDIVKRYNDVDVNQNKILDIEELQSERNKPIVVKKTKDLMNSIDKNNLNGEEVGMVLNFIISNLKTDEIPQIYKKEIKNNL